MQPYGILPAPTEETAPYWEAARRDTLAIVQCQDCEFYLHPNRFICVRCHKLEPNLAYVELSGRGTLYSYVLHYETRFNGFADKVPYIAAVVELDEQPGLTVWGNILNAEYEDLRPGLPVEAVWEDTDDPEIRMMQWRAAIAALRGNGQSAQNRMYRMNGIENPNPEHLVHPVD